MTDLRVLAIAAEPPEAFIDVQAKIVQPVRLRMLVVDPVVRDQLTANASLCFPSDNLICPNQRLDLPQQRVPVGEVVYDVQPSDQLAALIVGAAQDDKLKGLGGIRVQFSASVRDGDSNEPVAAAKTLLFSSVPPPQANHSPRVDRVQIIHSDGRTEDLRDGGSLLMDGAEEVGFLPILGQGPDGAETYTTTDLAGREVTLTEQPEYSFFTLQGAEWDLDRAFERLPTLPPATFGIARLRAFRPGSGKLWIVVRDGRGGLSWFSANWTAG